MTWQEFITKIESGLFGERFSDIELANKIGIRRETIYYLREGKSIKPQAATIRQIENTFNIKIINDKSGVTFNQIKLPELEQPKDLLYPVYNQMSMLKVRAEEYLPSLSFCSVESFWLNIITISYGNLIKSGDKILIDPKREIYNHDLVIVKLITGSEMIRKIYNLDPNRIMLYIEDCSENPLIIDKNEIEIMYRIIRIFKPI